jgi:enoyl-CoA hydratase/carnithine racemase
MIVETEVIGPVRQVLLNRSDKRNALNGEMIDRLEAIFSTPPGPEERLVVIRAAGPVFCAGLDLSDHIVATNPIENMLHKIETYPLPVVAIVQGDAIAGGNELALHCDLVVASTAARFGMSLAKIGLVPSWFLIKKLLEVAGPVMTRRILLLGDLLPAREFHDMGLISHIAAPQDLEAAAQAVIDRLSANAPLSLKAMKALIVREMTFRDRIAHEDLDRLVAEVNDGVDAKEGMAALLGKRAARFTGGD